MLSVPRRGLVLVPLMFRFMRRGASGAELSTSSYVSDSSSDFNSRESLSSSWAGEICLDCLGLLVDRWCSLDLDVLEDSSVVLV